ncbi:MAG: hypothetical protein PHR82_10050, partial [Endomicrobiaceae bacterium]|nr:hypothetical protein [Endomicrobiaceae bacterium]
GHIVGDVLDTKIKVSIIASFNKSAKTTRTGVGVQKVKKQTDSSLELDDWDWHSAAYETWKTKRL